MTELDVSVYSNSFPGPVLDYTNIPADRFVLQGYRYRTFFEAFKQAALAGKLEVGDALGQVRPASTWLTSSTRVDGPLLFDISFKKKHAYWAVVDPLQLPGADLSTTMTARADDGARGPGGGLHHHGDEQRRHRHGVRSSRPTTICRPPTCR